MPHRSRLAYVVVDCSDLDTGARFWSSALGGSVVDQPWGEGIYRTVQLPERAIALLLQLVPEAKTSKSRMHLDIETDDVESEVHRLCALGARRERLVAERGVRFWVLSDPFGNEFCVVHPCFPDLLAARPTWTG